VKGSDVRVSSAITSRPHEHFRDRVTATADGAGNFTFTVNDPNVGRYQFRIDTKFGIETDVDAMTGAWQSLQYSAMGVWSHSGFPGFEVGGAGAFGVATGSADLPKTGTATYSGAFLGRHMQTFSSVREPDTTVTADARSVANFGTGVVSFETSNSRINGAPNSDLDLIGSMTGAQTNQMQGTVSTKPGTAPMSGDIRATFFGPASATSAPPELGGSVSVKAPFSTTGGAGRSMVGGFIMKR
jgi:hypothetical protein